MYLLDTNVISELRKVRTGQADGNVARWFAQMTATDLYVSVVTLEELEIGILRLERRDSAQGSVFRSWIGIQVLPAFAGRILPVDQAVAQRSAQLHVPDPIPVRDGYIAATAIVHSMTVVTRNGIDFESTGVSLLNPWQS